MGAKEEPTVITQTKDEGGREQDDIPRGGEKWPNSRNFENIGYEVKREVKGNSKVWVFLTFLSIIQKEHNLKIKTSPSPKDPGSLTPASYLSIYPSTHLSITIDID